MLVVLAAAALVLAAVVAHPYLQRRHAKHDVDVLALALEGYAREHGQYPQGTPAQISALLRGEAVGEQNQGKLDYVEASAQEMNAAGEFIDPWGTPYGILFSPQAQVSSCGPNRIDESGGGDDIASWR
jgi:hypothetical protein